jgi:hypothetical protein
MENIEKTEQSDELSVLNNKIKNYLLETSKWGNFLAIVGYIGMGLMVLLALIVLLGSASFGQYSEFPFPMKSFGFLYIIIAAIYFFPVTYLYKFSMQIKNGLNSNDSDSLTYGFENLKSLFKFTGIFTIIILSIYALGIGIALIAFIL